MKTFFLFLTLFVLISFPVHAQEASLLSSLDPTKANVNGDGVVNGLDYASCLFVYGKPDLKCDIVADGEVNSLDMTYILGSYGAVSDALNSNAPTSGIQPQSQGGGPDTTDIDELLRQVEEYDKKLQELGIQ